MIIEDNRRFLTSTYEMLEHLVQVKLNIEGHIPTLDPEDRKWLTRVLPLDSDWEQIKALVKTLEPFKIIAKHYTYKDGLFTRKHSMASRTSVDYEVLLETLGINAVKTLLQDIQGLFTDFRFALAASLPKALPVSTCMIDVAILHLYFNRLWFLQVDAHIQSAIEKLRVECTALVVADSRV